MVKKEKYKITHPVMFAMVMKNAELCRGLIERILPGRKVRELRFVYAADEDEANQDVLKTYERIHPETEKTIIVGIEAKSVRMDVLFEDDEAWYDIELQIADVDHLPKRSRYYHAIKAVDEMEAGMPYAALKPGYVIFINTFDLFGKNLPVYFFEMRTENGLSLGDEQFTIFLNGACKENVPESLKSFYEYLQNGTVKAGDVWLEKVDAEVEEVNRQKEVRGKVTLYDEMLQWKTILEKTKEKLAETETQLAETETQLAETETQLAETETQLAETETQLVQKENELAESERIQKLHVLLAQQGRVEELLKAAEDEMLRQKLLEEFGL